MNADALAILGSGSWGTSLATLWGSRRGDVLLWGRNSSRIERLRETRRNDDYLPGVQIPDSVRLTSRIEDCAAAALIAFVTPSTALRQIAMQLQAAISGSNATLLSCTKGIEHGTGMRMSEILHEIFPAHTIAVLSGPNLALEVAKNFPAASVLGCHEIASATKLQHELGSERFRIYTSEEVTGIELGGALKNVFALAAGVSDGLRLGDNAKAALVTRSLAELLRLGTAMGGKPHTFYGLSGAGDLILTCFSQQSRNHSVGQKLGQGQSLPQIVASMQMVAEGIPTTRSAFECARKLDIDTPIIDQMYAMLYQAKPPVEALQELLRRDPKPE